MSRLIRLSLFIILLSSTGRFNPLIWAQPMDSIKLMLLEDRPEDVIRYAKRVRVADSLRDELLYLTGRAYQSLHKYDSAYLYYYMASEMDSLNPAYRVSRGSMLSKLGRTAEAIPVYESLRSDSLAGKQHLADLAALYSIRNNWSGSHAIYLELIREDSLNYYFMLNPKIPN